MTIITATLDILKEQPNEENRLLHVGKGLSTKQYPCYKYIIFDIYDMILWYLLNAQAKVVTLQLSNPVDTKLTI